MMTVKELSTTEMINELITREGVDWSEVRSGMEYKYVPPKDGHFIIVPRDAPIKKVTAKDRLDAAKAAFAEQLVLRYTEQVDKDAAMMLVQLFRG